MEASSEAALSSTVSQGSPGSPGSPGSRTATPTTAVRPRPRLPTTLTTNTGSKPEFEDVKRPLRHNHNHRHLFTSQPEPQNSHENAPPAKFPSPLATTDNCRKYSYTTPEKRQAEEDEQSRSPTDNRSLSSSPYITPSSPPPRSFQSSPPSHHLLPASPTCQVTDDACTAHASTNHGLRTPVRFGEATDQLVSQTRRHGHGSDVTIGENGERGQSCLVQDQIPTKLTASPIARAMSLVFRQNTTPSSVRSSKDFRTATLTHRPMRSLKEDPPAERQVEWEMESLESRGFVDEGQRLRPNSENSVLRSEEENVKVSGDEDLKAEGKKSRTARDGGKSRLERLEWKSRLDGSGERSCIDGGGGGGGVASVVRSFSLRKPKTLDRFVTSKLTRQEAHSNGSCLQRQLSVKEADVRMGDEGVASLGVEVSGYKSELSGKAEIFLRTLSSNRGEREEEARVNQTSKNAIIGRFLTHPPSRERGLTQEEGSVDSNGLGSLREGRGGHGRLDSETKNKTSFCSLDSHICSSEDASERMSFPSESTLEDDSGLGRLDRRNSKTLKQKSKSDPSAEKNNENVDLPTSLASIGIYAQSSPVLVEKDKQCFSFSQEEQEQEYDASGIVTGSLDSPSPEDPEVKDVLQSDESFEDQTPTSVGVKPPRPRFSKRRLRASAMPGSLEPSELTRKTFLREGDKPEKPSDEDSTPGITFIGPSVRTPSGKQSKPVLPSSLTLPLAKRTPSTRNQGSAEAERPPDLHQHPSEVQSPEEEPSSVDLREHHSSARHDFHLSTGQGGMKSLTNAIGGSFQELYRSASPRLKTRTAPSPASFSPSLDTILSHSALSLFEGSSEDKEKRDFILQEFYSTEKQYVEALQMLVEKYMIPMKTQNVVDSSIVDEIFYKINEIYMHHATFITFLDRALKNWDPQSTIGDIIYKSFSKQTVIDSYISFIEHFPRSEKVLDEVATKSSFQKLIEQCERETRTKLPLKAQIVKPAQRIPRYELLLKRLLDNTPPTHPDFPLLHQAERAMHQLALRINSVKESKHEEDLQETLKKLELLLITDLASPDRLYLRHDMVTIPSRKDQCCLWLFSDLLIISSIKRKSTSVNRRTSLLLQSPNGHDFVENSKHKVWLKIPLEAVDIVQGPEVAEANRQLADRQELESDFETLGKMVELSAKLKAPHQVVDDAVRDVFSHVNRQLAEHQLRTPPPEEHSLDVVANTQDGLVSMSIIFPSADKKSSWEAGFQASKQKIVQVTDKKLPEFLQPLPITKTRAGMQFSCATATEPSSTRLEREVLVCNSDGYVGHICLLNVVPEPIVTLNTPVSGCNSRILCICAVPPYQEPKRKRSDRRTGVVSPRTPQIRIEEIRSEDEVNADVSDSGTNSDSDSVSGSDEDTEDGERSGSSSQLQEAAEKASGPLVPLPSLNSSSKATSESTTANSKDSAVIDRGKSTVWLGTEDGCIQIFASTENIKTTKSKVKVQHSASILAIVYLNSRVFVSIANGDIVIYKRNKTDGTWDCWNPEVVNISNSSAPINRMISVNDHLWCACLSDVIVLDVPSANIKDRFSFNQDPKQGINCLAYQGQGIWATAKNSSKIVLYHATTHEQLLEVNIASAVVQKLQSTDDIIRQHKMACLRITALLCCKTLLWIGTSAGIVLTLPLPNIKSTSTKFGITCPPTITGLPFGHTGHVRFLTCVETPLPVPSSPSSSTATQQPHQSSPGFNPSPGAFGNMLVISGGDGYEDFRTSPGPGDTAGRDDSTNHLLLWRV